MLYVTVILSALIIALNGDMYMHYPRGSNNRLNEASANRNNANRLFDSQNNNRGGYNCCDLDTEEGFNEDNWMATPTQMYDWTFLYQNDANYERQYEEIYFVDSVISVTWTNQHGTGNKKLLSQIILQFGCDTFPRADSAGANSPIGGPAATISTVNTLGDTTSCGTACKDRLTEMRKHGLRMELLNGGNTNTPDEPDNNNDITATYQSNNNANRGRHESEEWYRLCEQRSQQYGLFHADQDLQGESQIYTRQNPAGTRRGLECPEERDYYPWWNPSPWHDIAIITPEMEYCQDHQAPESQNVKEKCTCSNPTASPTNSAVDQWFPADEYVEYNLNQTMCEDMGGDWSCFKWNGQEPECVDSYWSKVNYLGNVDGSTRGGKQATYDWTLPSWTDLRDNHYCWPYTYAINDVYDVVGPASYDIDCVRMVFRIRYNMSTMDYDPYKTNSTHDYDPSNPNGGILSPIEENPEVDVGSYVQGLQLAINTAQTGRTFQDRSHTFLVCKRENQAFAPKKIYNVNVRGKRGNIVQTFPATEYDFEPQHIEVSPTAGTCFHFQWCGSNTHNNGSPGGDGQTGDDGEGRGGSDRSNLVECPKMDESYPVTYDKMDVTDSFFNYATCYHPLTGVQASSEDAQLILGTAGFYKGVDYMKDRCSEITTYDNDEDRGYCIVDELLNNVSASFRAGLVCCLDNNISNDANYEKEFAFLSTRNNNFTNRDQKLKIVVRADPDDDTTW